MLKYASKFFLNIFLSVLATVIGSHLANQYTAGRPAADAPVSLADGTIDPKRPDANAASREAVKADITASEAPSAVPNALGLARAIGGRSVDKTNDEKAVPSVDRPAESMNAPARLHRSAPRHKQISKTNIIATPESASLTVAPPGPGRVITGRFFYTGANSVLDASPPPQEVGRDDDVSPPLEPEMTGSHLTGRVLKPIIRTALLLLEPASLLGHAHEHPACFAFHARDLQPYRC